MLVSALIKPAGPPGQIVERFYLPARPFQMVLSPGILRELRRVLAYGRVRRLITSPPDPKSWCAKLEEHALLVSDRNHAGGVCRDSDDDRYLSAALEGQATVVVTGDRDLLDLGTHRGVEIVTPRRFLDRLGG